MDGKDQRSTPRYVTRIFGVFSRDIDLDETEMLMTNLSLGGAFVRTETPPSPGTPVTLRMYVPGEDVPVSIAGEVVWCRRADQGDEPGMGVRFVQVAPKDLERLRRYLAGLVEEALFK